MTATFGTLSTFKSRWYAPTPAKFLFAMLLMQGALFLSAHYRWFWFNERKGYTVLITVAATAICLMILMGAVLVSRFFRAKAQYSLGTLLLMVPVTAIPCAWLAREIEQARQQRDLVGLATVNSDFDFDIGPKDDSKDWLTRTLGEDFFRDVIELAHWCDSATDEDLVNLKRLPHLERLDLVDTRITDVGLEHLKGLTQLRRLHLHRASVTDAGLQHLKGLTQLQQLSLKRTQVTNDGVERLQRALPDCAIWRYPDERGYWW